MCFLLGDMLRDGASFSFWACISLPLAMLGMAASLVLPFEIAAISLA